MKLTDARAHVWDVETSGDSSHEVQDQLEVSISDAGWAVDEEADVHRVVAGFTLKKNTFIVHMHIFWDNISLEHKKKLNFLECLTIFSSTTGKIFVPITAVMNAAASSRTLDYNIYEVMKVIFQSYTGVFVTKYNSIFIRNPTKCYSTQCIFLVQLQVCASGTWYLMTCTLSSHYHCVQISIFTI